MSNRLILTLDSSQIETFLQCDRKWFHGYNENLTLNNEVREDMMMGTYGHKLLELYYYNKAMGFSMVDSAEIALSFPLTDFPLDTKNTKKVREAFNRYTMIYGGNDVTVLMGKPTREYKFDEVTGGFDEEIWKLNPLVEKGFSYPLLNTPDYLFVLEGRIDLLCNLNGQDAYLDHKFQGREKKLYKKRIQFRNYALVTGVRLGIINYIRYHEKLAPNTFERQLINYSEFENQWWKKELIKIFVRISHAMRIGEFEQRWNSCEGYGGNYTCPFIKICEERNEVVRENIKSQFYRIKEKWSPW